jgi:hypothetical protein
MLTVRRDALALVAASAQHCLANHGPEASQPVGLVAIAELGKSLSAEPEPPRDCK